MAYIESTEPLDRGAIFPPLSLQRAAGGEALVPVPGATYSVVLIYRGEW